MICIDLDGDYARAIDDYTAALEIEPGNAMILQSRAVARRTIGQWEEAYADYHQALELSPPYHEIYANLGQCCRMMGQLEEAVMTTMLLRELGIGFVPWSPLGAGFLAGSADRIVTLNARDFPRNLLAEEGLDRIDPDALLTDDDGGEGEEADPRRLARQAVVELDRVGKRRIGVGEDLVDDELGDAQKPVHVDLLGASRCRTTREVRRRSPAGW